MEIDQKWDFSFDYCSHYVHIFQKQTCNYCGTVEDYH